jgi:hypothetical protein
VIYCDPRTEVLVSMSAMPESEHTGAVAYNAVMEAYVMEDASAGKRTYLEKNASTTHSLFEVR